MWNVILSQELTLPVIAVRLVLSFIAGGIIGAERERRTTPAGLRTHILIFTGATLLMLVSIHIGSGSGDPGRIAAQVVSGIGFLGAGAIMRFGATVQGLTSAASIWAIAALGLSIGAGYFFAAGIFTLLLLIALIILDWIEKRYMPHRALRAIYIVQKGQNFNIDPYRKTLEKYSIELKHFEISFSKDKMQTTLKLVARVPMDLNLAAMAEEISARKRLIKFRINQNL